MKKYARSTIYMALILLLMITAVPTFGADSGTIAERIGLPGALEQKDLAPVFALDSPDRIDGEYIVVLKDNNSRTARNQLQRAVEVRGGQNHRLLRCGLKRLRCQDGRKSLNHIAKR